MSALTKNLQQIWQQLRSQKATRADFLDQIQIRRLRGIDDLRVALPYPVCVLAGANGCGKSTVLFSLACAYRDSGPAAISRTPGQIFPDFNPKDGIDADLADQHGSIEISYSYIASGQPLQMAWKRGKSWSRSFFGRKSGVQPVRPVYLHTLSKLTNPSEVRSVLQLAQRKFTHSDIDASNIAFAQRVLGFQYARLTQIRAGKRDLLVAERTDNPGQKVHYSEFHMSAGERAVIRLSVHLSKLENVLVLIDEVEAGLHPHVQQLLMLELQRLALRNSLQIICTSHSPAVLETVPPEARIFLERISGNVVRREAYRDLIQKALYGRSQDVLSFLCEDEEAEGFIRGLLDHLGPKLDFLQNDVEVGRDTGKNEYPAHLATLARFRKLGDVVFVLDGDGRDIKPTLEQLAEKQSQAAQVLCLPGDEPPEAWIWRQMKLHPERYTGFFEIGVEALQSKLVALENTYANAADKPSAIAKNRALSLVEEFSRATADLLRYAGKTEAESQSGDVHEVVTQLEDFIRTWRTARN